MASLKVNIFPDNIKRLVDKMINQPCTQIHIRNDFSMYVSFGELKLFRKSPLSYIGTWEIGTYNCAWRIIYKDKILCGSDDICDKGSELMLRIKNIPRGNLQSFIPLSDFDFTISLDTGLRIDFLCGTSTDDQILHVYVTDTKCAVYHLQGGWSLQDRIKE